MDVSLFLINAGKVAGGITAILAFLKLAAAILWKPFKKHFDKIDQIYKELTPNGGGSLKDTVTLLKNSLIRIEQRQKMRLNYDDHGIFETDGEGKLTWGNRSFLKMLRATAEEVEGYGWKNFIEFGSRAAVLAEWNSAIQDGRDYKGTFFFRSSSGERICVSCEVLAVKESGKVAAYLGFAARKEDGFCRGAGGEKVAESGEENVG